MDVVVDEAGGVFTLVRVRIFLVLTVGSNADCISPTIITMSLGLQRMQLPEQHRATAQ